MACIASVGGASALAGGLRAEQVVNGATTSFEATVPVLLTVTSAPGILPRMPKVKDAMMARRKAIRVLGPAELTLDAERAAPGYDIERLAMPVSDVRCEMIVGDVGTQATHLVARLRELHVI